MKLDSGDWHAVCDAGMDLREIDTELRIYEDMRKVQAAESKQREDMLRMQTGGGSPLDQSQLTYDKAYGDSNREQAKGNR